MTVGIAGPLASILSAGLGAAEAFGDDVDSTGRPVTPLRADELAVLGGCSPRRLREVSTGRHCARAALAAIGITSVSVGRLASGAPAWPDGVVGSITHCRGYRAAAVARVGSVAAIGIDAEPHAALPVGVRSTVLRDDESEELDSGPAAGLHGDRLLFSAKEAVYKALHLLDARPVRFHEVRVRLGDGVFRAELVLPGDRTAVPQPALDGSWCVHEGLVVTAAVLRDVPR